MKNLSCIYHAFNLHLLAYLSYILHFYSLIKYLNNDILSRILIFRTKRNIIGEKIELVVRK